MSRTIALDARLLGGQYTGDTVYWTGLIQGLMSLESENRYLLYSNEPKPSTVPDSVRFRWIQVTSKRSRWWSLFRFPLAARRAGAEVIHTQYNLSPLVTRGGVTTIHDVSFFVEPSWFRPQDRVLLQRFVPSSARRSGAVITVSEFSKAEICRYVPGIGPRIWVAPNACPSSIERRDRLEAGERVRSSFGIEGPFLLAVGTRWPRKNLNLAIAAADVVAEELGIKLVVTGKPGWGEEVVSRHAIHPGFVSDGDLSDLYSSAEVYLAPALYEGFGITLLEAFRCGCPVVASPIAAHLEVAKDCALFPESMDVDAWVGALRRLMGDSQFRSDLAAKGLRREADFTWEGSAKIHEAAYEAAI